jgi:putative transposase
VSERVTAESEATRRGALQAAPFFILAAAWRAPLLEGVEPGELRFFNPYAEIRHTTNRLPHWQQEGAVYFGTFRLGDSVPQHLSNQWMGDRSIWIQLHPEPWSYETAQEYHKRFSGAIERWLDVGYGECVLRRPECAEIVADTLRHFDGERLGLVAFIVMPNHVHAVFVQHPEWPLEKILRSWKSFTTRRLNELLGRSGSLWQRDYFDRLVRDHAHFANCVRYIRRNPEKARLRSGEFAFYESDLAKAIT